MLELTRCVRLCVSRRPRRSGSRPEPGANTYAGWPRMTGLGAYYEIEVTCGGEIDPRTEYLLNIATIDRAVREQALPRLEEAFEAASAPVTVLASMWGPIDQALAGGVTLLRWRLTPYYSLAMTSEAPDRILIAQQFDFAAAHRLHSDAMSDEENRQVFGKCNNPSGHGHNYRLEVVASTDLDDSDAGFDLSRLEPIVMERVLEHLDHKHLNRDVPEFTDLNPTVERIAKVCHDLLLGPIAEAGGRLEQVTVWETEKTRCTYPAALRVAAPRAS